jgi:F-type H+-transporting ATPase subunit delta
MSQEAIARRYARAVFELGRESQSETLAREIDSFAQLYQEQAELRAVLDNPLVHDDARDGILRDVGERLGLSDLALRSLRVLIQNRRTSALPALAEELNRLTDETQGIVRATVTSAGPLSSAYLDRLRGELERSTGKKVVVTHETDASLIGGVVTRVGDRVIDGSLRAKLSQFRDSVLPQT